MQMDGREKRRHRRVKLPYMMKFRSTRPGAKEAWDAVTPINMSESGICFLTMEPLPVGSGIQFNITNPLGAEELTYECKVLRSRKSKTRSVFFETVITIERMPDQAREIYTKLLAAFSKEGNEEKDES
jgi:hypothetical protein